MCLNTASIAKRKSNWIDFNAGELIESNDFENMTEEIFKLLIDIASGRQTKNEQNGYRDISIFKDGVIMYIKNIKSANEHKNSSALLLCTDIYLRVNILQRIVNFFKPLI